MKERPILFSGAMVGAIIDGRKAQTRRLLKLCKSLPRFDGGQVWKGPSGLAVCPYGRVGDRLWVREAWGLDNGLPDEYDCVHFRADGLAMHVDGRAQSELFKPSYAFSGRWRPSIHMPRWASRITLEVTGVRVEPLQEISEDDAIAEGIPECVSCQPSRWGRGTQDDPLSSANGGKPWSTCHGVCQGESAKETFQRLWDDINGKKVPWSSNPLVWVVEFRKASEVGDG